MKKLMFIALFSILGISAASAQCTITTDCETVTIEGTSSISASSQSQGDGTYLLTATSEGEIVYQAVCNSGAISASCSSTGGGGDDDDNGFCEFLISIGAPQYVLDFYGCN